MATIKDGLYYSKEHEWVRVEGDLARIGITDYAQQGLGDIVFADGEPKGSVLMAGGVCGAVESVKAASDVYTPVSGNVEEINEAVQNAPELINEAPYEHWILALRLSDPSELGELMDASDYAAYCETL
jgi:glycine cleavage system H protein